MTNLPSSQTAKPNDLDADAAIGRSWQELGDILESARQYLLAVANGELAPQLRAKEGASDLVQETLLEAQRKLALFDGQSTEQLFAWLRGILLYKLCELNRRYRKTGKRQISREHSLDAAAACDGLADEQTSPSGAAIRSEEAERLFRAMDRLPEQYRRVILWREFDGLSLDEIAERLQRTKVAARMLWARAIERLQHELEHTR